MPVALITGGSSGLGRALTHALARAGWELVVDARDPGRLEQALTGLGPGIHAIPGDITQPAHRADLAAACAGLGRLDLLVNNAGGLGPSPLPPLSRFPLTALEDLFRVNVVAPLALIQLTLPLLTAGTGTIVNITSDAATGAYPGWGGYGSTKAALDQLTAVLGAETTGGGVERTGGGVETTGAGEPTPGGRSGVRVYALDPGDLRTPMHQAAFPGEDISDRPLPESVTPAFLRLLAERPPNGRYRTADFAVPGSKDDAEQEAGVSA